MPVTTGIVAYVGDPAKETALWTLPTDLTYQRTITYSKGVSARGADRLRLCPRPVAEL